MGEKIAHDRKIDMFVPGFHKLLKPNSIERFRPSFKSLVFFSRIVKNFSWRALFLLYSKRGTWNDPFIARSICETIGETVSQHNLYFLWENLQVNKIMPVDLATRALFYHTEAGQQIGWCQLHVLWNSSCFINDIDILCTFICIAWE